MFTNIKAGDEFITLKPFQAAVTLDKAGVKCIVVAGANNTYSLMSDNGRFVFDIASPRAEEIFNKEYFERIGDFKLGDLIISKEDKGGSSTGNRKTLLQVVDEPITDGWIRSKDTTVKILASKYRQCDVGVVLTINAEDYEPYRNGVLEWLHA